MRAAGAGTWPKHGWLGLALVAIAWPLSWGLEGLRTHLLFAPQWFGYVLVVDAWTLRRTGTSALTRSRADFALRFALSAPIWWLFEALNLRLRNWEYLGRERFTDLEYFLLASISFSTVLPAVLGTAELVSSMIRCPSIIRCQSNSSPLRIPRRKPGDAKGRRIALAPYYRRAPYHRRGPRLRVTRAFEIGCFAVGLAMLAALLVWPRAAYPFAWTSLVLLVEPLCRWTGRRSLGDELSRGDWRRWIALWGGGLVCGFFWELWNFYAYPKWIYHVPGVEFWKLFEMPALGYLGYLPFALELQLLAWLCAPRAGAWEPRR
jgi:hypothetical protein